MDSSDQQYPADKAQGFDYNAVFNGVQGGEAERKVSGITIPSFGYYVVRFGGAKASFKATGTPSVRAWCQVKEGPEGTLNALVGDDVGNPFIAPSPTMEVDGVKVRKDSTSEGRDLLFKQADAIQRILDKIARVGKFALARPSNLNDLASLEAYAAQFAQGFDAVVEISTEKNEYQGNTTFRNRIKWESLAAFDDPAVTKEHAGKTAIEEAKIKIAERNKALASKGGPKTGTAGATSRTSPEALFN